jgi:hypothetical protein
VFGRREGQAGGKILRLQPAALRADIAVEYQPQRLKEFRFSGVVFPNEARNARPYLHIKVAKISEILNEQTADKHTLFFAA